MGLAHRPRCANETYMDGPLRAVAVRGRHARAGPGLALHDGRREARAQRIELLDDSRTRRRDQQPLPDALAQFIAPFSLGGSAWCTTRMHQDDPEFVRRRLEGVRAVAGLLRRAAAGGRTHPGACPGGISWTGPTMARRSPAGEDDGRVRPPILQLLMATTGPRTWRTPSAPKHRAREYRQRAVSCAGRAHCTGPARKLFADTPRRRQFSQQTNALAVWRRDDGRGGARRRDEDARRHDADDRPRLLPPLPDSAVNKSGGWATVTWKLLGPGAGCSRRAHTLGGNRRADDALRLSRLGLQPTTSCSARLASPRRARLQARHRTAVLGKWTRAYGSIPHPGGEVSVKLSRVGGKSRPR